MSLRDDVIAVLSTAPEPLGLREIAGRLDPHPEPLQMARVLFDMKKRGRLFAEPGPTGKLCYRLPAEGEGTQTPKPKRQPTGQAGRPNGKRKQKAAPAIRPNGRAGLEAAAEVLIDMLELSPAELAKLAARLLVARGR